MTGAPVTLVFTDLVSSTAVKAALPGEDQRQRNQAYLREILGPHRQRVTALLARRNGRVVKTEGDGHFLVFTDPADAVRWAVELQEEHLAHPIPTPLGPLQVRVGIHTGTPLAEGGDYLGREVDYAARLVELADGGQVLLSESTAALLRSADPGLFTCHPHGLRDLKGIGRVPVFELLYGGRSPGRLRDGSAASDNLPPPPEEFVGRAEMLARIGEAVRAGGVTVLKGEGGIGKTTLALAVAHAVHRSGFLTGGGVLRLLATTISPSWGTSRFSTSTRSPSRIWSSIMESPRTRSR